MTISKPVKLLVGALSVWPFVYLVLFVGFVATSVFWIGQTEADESGLVPIAFGLVFVVHFATILSIFGLTIFYVVFLFKTDRVPQEKKALWAVVLVLGNMLANPVFYYLYVWPDEWPGLDADSPERQPGGREVDSGEPRNQSSGPRVD